MARLSRRPGATGPAFLAQTSGAAAPARRTFALAGGALVAGSPLPLLLARWLEPAQVPVVPSASFVAAAVASLVLAMAGLLMPFSVTRGRWLASAGVVLGLLSLGPVLASSPALAFAACLGGAALIAGLWASEARWWSPGPEDKAAQRARGSALSSVGLWVTAAVSEHASEPFTAVIIGGAFVICYTWTATWLVRAGRSKPGRALVLSSASALAGLGVAMSWGAWKWCLAGLALMPALAVLVLPRHDETSTTRASAWDPVLSNPARLLVATFFGLCIAGTLILALPACAANGESIGLVDAAFTAVSAVCVTGLIVLDTPQAFSPLGEAALLLFIQLGGLGIMAFSTAAMRLLRMRISLRHEAAVAGLLSADDRSQLYDATRRLIAFTLGAEAAGAAVLWLLFWRAEGAGPAAWRGLFTAISAFCNAGFALQTTSLIPYQHDPWVLHTVALLIILGGLSPLTALHVPMLAKGTRWRVAGQHKLAIYVSLFLLALGFVLFLALEWNQSLAGLSVGDRLHNAWFQSVTLRTAGFNSVDVAEVRPATLMVMMLWMLIGGSPGGTAGGLKTTTAAVLLLAVAAAVSGRWQVVAFNRRISHETVYKSAAIATAGLISVFLVLLAVLVTQAMPLPTAMFEVVSALGTVGLSIGGTGYLDGVGKGIIVAGMFAGRVGPLTLFMFLSHHTRPTHWNLPEGDLEVG